MIKITTNQTTLIFNNIKVQFFIFNFQFFYFSIWKGGKNHGANLGYLLVKHTRFKILLMFDFWYVIKSTFL